MSREFTHDGEDPRMAPTTMHAATAQIAASIDARRRRLEVVDSRVPRGSVPSPSSWYSGVAGEKCASSSSESGGGSSPPASSPRRR